MSDNVVSHGCECLETHGWVQLPAITEAVCVAHCEIYLEMELGLFCFLPSPLPVCLWSRGGPTSPPLPPLARQSTSTSVNDSKPHLLLIQRAEKIICSLLINAQCYVLSKFKLS